MAIWGLDSRRGRKAWRVAEALALLWALLVGVLYLGVDRGFLWPFLESLGRSVILGGLWGCLGLFGLGLGIGASGRLGGVGVLASLVCAALAVCVPEVRATLAVVLAPFVDQVDGVRASFALAGGAALGAGLALGARIGGRPLPLGVLVLLLGLPFIVVAVIGKSALALAGIVWVGWIARHLGRFWFRILAGRGEPAATPLLLEVAIGLGLLISGGLLLGLAGGSTRAGILLYLAALTAPLLPGLREDLARLGAIPWRKPVRLEMVAATGAGAALALFLMLWIAALGPEVGADAIGFRTAGPVQWMERGVLAGIPEMLGSYGMCAGEVLNLLLLPLAGLPVAKIVQAGLGVLLALSAARLVPRGLGRIFLLIGFWGSTHVWWQYAWGFVDLVQVFFYFAAILATGRWLEEGRRFWLATAGAAGGLAAAVKINGAGAPVIVLLIVLLASWRRGTPGRRIAGDLTALGVPFFLFLAPWCLRSFLLTGNPIFPFANGFFGSPLGPVTSLSVPFGVGLSPLALLELPWRLFFDPLRFTELGTWHPALLALAPVCLLGLAMRGCPRPRPWLAAAALSGAAWILTEQNGRYSLFPMLFFLIPAATGLGQRLERLGRPLGKPAEALLLAFLLVGLSVQLCRPRSWLWRGIDGSALPLGCVLGSKSEEHYLELELPTYAASRWFVRHASPEDRVLLLTNMRDHLYFPIPVVARPHGIGPLLGPLDPVLDPKAEAWNPESAHRVLRELGYSHLIFDCRWPRLTRVPEAEWQGIFGHAFTSRYLELVHAHQGVRLYRIRAQAGAPWAQGSDLLAGRLPEVLNPSQGLPVELNTVSERLYAIVLELGESPVDTGFYLQVSWMDGLGLGRFILQRRFEPGAPPGRYWMYQTAPVETVRARVELFGGAARVVDLQFRPLEVVFQEPRERG